MTTGSPCDRLRASDGRKDLTQSMLIRNAGTDKAPIPRKSNEKRDIKRPTNLLLPAFARITGLSSPLALVVRYLGSRHGGEWKGDSGSS